MPSKKTISFAIVAHNEEAKIKDCLESCRWADETILIDAGSTDSTTQIARSMKAKVYSVDNQPLMKINMNLSFEKCQSDWIFSLDADERISPQLKDEITRVINSGQKFAAYQVPRKNIIFKKWIEHSGWYPDYQIRLFQKGKGKFPAKNVHELLQVDGAIGTLKNNLEHLHYESVFEFVEKLNRYTDVEAAKLIDENTKVKSSDAIRFPKEEFLSRFFARQGYKDGLHGLVLSMLMAFYWEVVFAKIWEKDGFKNEALKEFAREIASEFEKASKDFGHWITEMSIDQKPAKKLYYKIKRRLTN